MLRLMMEAVFYLYTGKHVVTHCNTATLHFIVSYGDTLPHTVVGVCGEFQRTGRFLQRGI